MKGLATENARRAELRADSMALVRDRAKGKIRDRGEACHETATASHYSRRQSRSLCARGWGGKPVCTRSYRVPARPGGAMRLECNNVRARSANEGSGTAD